MEILNTKWRRDCDAERKAAVTVINEQRETIEELLGACEMVLAWATNQNVDQMDVWPRLFEAMLGAGYDQAMLDDIALGMLRGVAAAQLDDEVRDWVLYDIGTRYDAPSEQS
jgi:hypothetical protein